MTRDDSELANRQRHAAMINSAIARAARTNKPLVISALPSTDSNVSAQTDVLTGNAAWLDALAAQVRASKPVARKIFCLLRLHQ